MDTLTLAGPTPVMYYDPADELLDGCGYNVLLANGSIAARYPTADQAFQAFRQLVA
jgi:hypothetical protein